MRSKGIAAVAVLVGLVLLAPLAVLHLLRLVVLALALAVQAVLLAGLLWWLCVVGSHFVPPWPVS